MKKRKCSFIQLFKSAGKIKNCNIVIKVYEDFNNHNTKNNPR